MRDGRVRAERIAGVDEMELPPRIADRGQAARVNAVEGAGERLVDGSVHRPDALGAEPEEAARDAAGAVGLGQAAALQIGDEIADVAVGLARDQAAESVVDVADVLAGWQVHGTELAEGVVFVGC